MSSIIHLRRRRNVMAFFGKNDNYCCKIGIEIALLLVRSRLLDFRRLPASGYMAKDAFRAPLIYPALGNWGVYYFNQTICAHRDEYDVSGEIYFGFTAFFPFAFRLLCRRS